MYCTIFFYLFILGFIYVFDTLEKAKHWTAFHVAQAIFIYVIAAPPEHTRMRVRARVCPACPHTRGHVRWHMGVFTATIYYDLIV